MQPAERAGDRAGQSPADEGDEADDDSADRAETEPEPMDAGGDVAGVDRDAHRAVDGSPGGDGDGDVENVGGERVGGSGPLRSPAEQGVGDLRAGREVPVGGGVGVHQRDAVAVDHDDPGPGAVLVLQGRGRIERTATLQAVLVDRRDHRRVVFEIGADPLPFPLVVEHGEGHFEDHEHEDRDRQVAEQETAGHDAVAGAATSR